MLSIIIYYLYNYKERFNPNEITIFDLSFNDIPIEIKKKYIQSKKNIFLYKDIKDYINDDNIKIKDDGVCYYTYENPQIEQVYNYGLIDPSQYIFENDYTQLDSYDIYDQEFKMISPYQKKIYYCDNINDDNLPECSYLSCNKYNNIEKHIYKMKDDISSIRNNKKNEAKMYLNDKKNQKRDYYEYTKDDIINDDIYLENNISNINSPFSPLVPGPQRLTKRI